MIKQCLDVQQMQHLQELGLELKETMMYWARCVDNNPRAATHYGKWVLIKGNSAQTVGLMRWEFIPAYTLQDVLDALPATIEHGGKLYMLMIDMLNRAIHYFRFTEVLTFVKFKGIPFIDAAYNLLCWAIEQGYVETDKNE